MSASDSTSCETYQVAVIGGGLVGAAAALALLKAGLRVVMIEQHAVPTPSEAWDARIYAISPASEALLRDLGVWQRMDAARLQPVYRMDVYGDTQAHLRFDAYESGIERLATILESRRLQHALWQTIREHDPDAIRCPAQLESIDWGSPFSTVHLVDGSRFKTELIVAADGGHSRVRQMAGLIADTQTYAQQGIVANFACEKPHRGTAFQWFGAREPGEILTYLPLAGSSSQDLHTSDTPPSGNRMSLVWSTQRAPAMLAMSADAFAREVEQASEARLGKLHVITPPASFPLHNTRVDQVYRSGVVLIGDAAHGVHPLAGQGVNLGLGDVTALRSILESRSLARCGDASLLARYARLRAWPIAQMQGVLHGLHQLFDGDSARWIRNTGMDMLNHLGVVKTALVQQATRFHD